MSSRKAIDAEQARAMGARIRHLRGSDSQAQFASELGVDRATLANYEAGRRIPNDEFLKKLSDFKDISIPEILFGTHITPYKKYMENVMREIEVHMKMRPGVIPKFMISDDELALILAVRLAMLDDHATEPLLQIIQHAKRVYETDHDIGLPPYGEAQITRLEAALQAGKFEEGYDPDLAFFVTFSEGSGGGSS
ncbi:helix-turn-helix transcriptional regulator [Methylobacterium platani]|uniref:helix-turn-helix transcriptional regulator n=1 Tax=Methylobacterium platani TaxID=427683 RepID=UPI0009E42D8D|nr:helix-turn-helix transcriptional regulator [Methylobacterium platani]